MFRILSLLLTLSFLSGCGTLNAARPMEPGQHRAGVTFGGPFTTTLGPPIPIPNLIVEGRSGLEPVAGRPLDVNYGLNATGIAFGQLGLHGGASIHLVEGSGKRPSISVTERVHLYNNYLDTTKPLETRKFWGLNELDVTLSWALGRHLVYVGGSDIVDLADPELLLAPFLGMELQPKDRRIAFQLESRLLGANFSPEVWDVTWLTVGEEPGYGLISITASASWALGKEKEK
jgi:hypothetical protein